MAVAVSAYVEVGAQEWPEIIDTGVSGGTIHHVFRDESRNSREFTLEIPDGFIVVDVQGSLSRLLVTVHERIEIVGKRRTYRSEVWQFGAPIGGVEAINYEERVVLVALETRYGEPLAYCAKTVNCPTATAVQVTRWESSSIQLFDSQGVEIQLDRGALIEQCGFSPEFVRPVVWLEAEGKWSLVCHVSELGGGPHLVTYSDTGEVESVVSTESELGPFGERIITFLGWNF